MIWPACAEAPDRAQRTGGSGNRRNAITRAGCGLVEPGRAEPWRAYGPMRKPRRSPRSMPRDAVTPGSAL